MKPFLKVAFQPVANRHYTSEKTSVLYYAANYLPVLIIALVGGILVDKFFFLVFIGIILYSIIDYVVFDAFLDRLAWNLFWSRFYKSADASTPSGYGAIKQFDKNPTADNYEAVERELTKK
jgi:hypothetical protein